MGIEPLTFLFMPPGLGGLGIGKDPLSKSKGSDGPAPSPQPLPEPPKVDASAQEAQKQIAKRRSSATKTVYTDPLGISGQADVVRKTLTGQ